MTNRNVLQISFHLHANKILLCTLYSNNIVKAWSMVEHRGSTCLTLDHNHSLVSITFDLNEKFSEATLALEVVKENSTGEGSDNGLV